MKKRALAEELAGGWEGLRQHPIAGTALGIGSFFPVAGSAISAGDMMQNLYRGNMASAGLNAVGVAAGMLPGGKVLTNLASKGRLGQAAAKAAPYLAPIPGKMPTIPQFFSAPLASAAASMADQSLQAERPTYQKQMREQERMMRDFNEWRQHKATLQALGQQPQVKEGQAPTTADMAGRLWDITRGASPYLAAGIAGGHMLPSYYKDDMPGVMRGALTGGGAFGGTVGGFMGGGLGGASLGRLLAMRYGLNPSNAALVGGGIGGVLGGIGGHAAGRHAVGALMGNEEENPRQLKFGSDKSAAQVELTPEEYAQIIENQKPSLTYGAGMGGMLGAAVGGDLANRARQPTRNIAASMLGGGLAGAGVGLGIQGLRRLLWRNRGGNPIQIKFGSNKSADFGQAWDQEVASPFRRGMTAVSDVARNKIVDPIAGHLSPSAAVMGRHGFPLARIKPSLGVRAAHGLGQASRWMGKNPVASGSMATAAVAIPSLLALRAITGGSSQPQAEAGPSGPNGYEEEEEKQAAKNPQQRAKGAIKREMSQAQQAGYSAFDPRARQKALDAGRSRRRGAAPVEPPAAAAPLIEPSLAAAASPPPPTAAPALPPPKPMPDLFIPTLTENVFERQRKSLGLGADAAAAAMRPPTGLEAPPPLSAWGRVRAHPMVNRIGSFAASPRGQAAILGTLALGGAGAYWAGRRNRKKEDTQAEQEMAQAG